MIRCFVLWCSTVQVDLILYVITGCGMMQSGLTSLVLNEPDMSWKWLIWLLSSDLQDRWALLTLSSVDDRTAGPISDQSVQVDLSWNYRMPFRKFRCHNCAKTWSKSALNGWRRKLFLSAKKSPNACEYSSWRKLSSELQKWKDIQTDGWADGGMKRQTVSQQR